MLVCLFFVVMFVLFVGRMRAVLEKIPVFVVLHEQVGLLGAQVVCKRLLSEQGFTMKGELAMFAESIPRHMSISQPNENQNEVLKGDSNTLPATHVHAVPHTPQRASQARSRCERGDLSHSSICSASSSRRERLSDLTIAAVAGGTIASLMTVVFVLLSGWNNRTR
jgi:hypothetical protein